MDKKNTDLLQGTLDMLILKVLTLGAMHGYSIMNRIQQVSDEVLRIEEGSLYPALHRMQQRGWIAAEWGVSENNRRAKFYHLTPTGVRQLKEEVSLWERLSQATSQVINVAPEA